MKQGSGLRARSPERTKTMNRKNFKVTYEEVLHHGFLIKAESFDDVPEALANAQRNGELDFSDGNPEIGEIIRIEDEEGRIKCPNDSYSSLYSYKYSKANKPREGEWIDEEQELLEACAHEIKEGAWRAASKNVEALRALYPEGTVLELISMDDKHAPAPGTKGKVSHIDDRGTIHMKWDTGSTLGLIPGFDKFRSHGLPKFLCVSASTENNEAITSVYESKDLESLIEATLDYEVYDVERDAIMKQVDKAGYAVYPDEDDPIVEVYIRRSGSPFGTDQAEVRVWRSDVLERYNQTYIELPLQGAKSLAPAKTSCATASTPKPCVVISHSFDTETIVYEYDSDDEATEALVRHYDTYMDEEKRNGSSLDESGCFCEEAYARITWTDGCKTEFTLSFISKEVHHGR